MGPPVLTASTNASISDSLSLVLPAARLSDGLATSGPDCGRLEVVEPRRPAAPRGVHRLFGEPDITAGEVGDSARGAVGEAERRLQVALLRPTYRVDLLDRAAAHQASVSMKCPPSPTNRDPSASSLRYQLSFASGPALTRYLVDDVTTAGPNPFRIAVNRGANLG